MDVVADDLEIGTLLDGGDDAGYPRTGYQNVLWLAQTDSARGYGGDKADQALAEAVPAASLAMLFLVIK